MPLIVGDMGRNTKTLKLWVALKAGVPLSVTMTLIEFVEGACAIVGRQEKMLLPELSVALVGAASRLQVKVCGGTFASVAELVSVKVRPARMVWLPMALGTGAAFGRATLSNVAALTSALLCAVTAKPQSEVLAKPVTFELPIVTQFTPLDE